VFDLEDAAEAFEAHVSGKHPKIVIRCNHIEDGGGAA
jgi:L-iditol 2-dehydrogenase